MGFPVEVRCQSFGGAFVDTGAELGWVPFGADGVPERRTLIKYEPCDALRDYLRSDGVAPTYDQLVAVHVLTHEAMHMAGLADEAEAECAAVQRDARMAELLGASPGDAALLAETYWLTVYPRMADGYRTGDCRPARKAGRAPPAAPVGCRLRRVKVEKPRLKQGQGDLASLKRRRRRRGSGRWRPNGRSRSRWCG